MENLTQLRGKTDRFCLLEIKEREGESTEALFCLWGAF